MLYMRGTGTCRGLKGRGRGSNRPPFAVFIREYQGQRDPRNIKTAKDFLIFHTKSGKGRLDPERMAQSSAQTFWKSFRTAWMRETGNEFSDQCEETPY